MVTELQPGVAIVDLAADSLSGFDAVRRIQLGKKTRHTPVILVTPKKLDAPTRATFLTASFEDIASPLDELSPTLHELLRRRSARAVRLAAASLA